MNTYTAKDVTLYVPYYNASRTILRVIEAVYSQTEVPGRVIIINDGSIEPLPKVTCEVIEHEQNKGLAAARNTALDHCNTPLIAALDADVIPNTNWLEKMLECLNSSEAAGVGGCLFEKHRRNMGDRWRSVHMCQNWGKRKIIHPRFIYGANTLFITQRLKDAGGYDPVCRTNNEDSTMSDALYEMNCELIYTPDAICWHLRRDTSRTILPGYWGWHHAKGVQQGDFDSPEGIIDRIERVNFGIFDYRFHLDSREGRADFMAIDALIPWVFCILDLNLYHRRNNSPVPDIRGMLNEVIPDKELYNLLIEYLPSHQGTHEPEEWHSRYLETFNKCLEKFSWKPECGIKELYWAIKNEVA